jgi:hypothetical protein
MEEETNLEASVRVTSNSTLSDKLKRKVNLDYKIFAFFYKNITITQPER